MTSPIPQSGLTTLRARYPGPTARPALPPIDWSLDGGGRNLVTECIARSGARFVLEWSYWRRRHQAIARACHIKRRRAVLGEKRSL